MFLFHKIINLLRFCTMGINHHIGKHIERENGKGKDPMDTIDRAYIQASDQIRNIVEYEIPKLLCLFEAL